MAHTPRAGLVAPRDRVARALSVVWPAAVGVMRGEDRLLPDSLPCRDLGDRIPQAWPLPLSLLGP